MTAIERANEVMAMKKDDVNRPLEVSNEFKLCRSTAHLYEACENALAYDEAIKSCANDPDKMSSYCSATGETLDRLYWKWMQSAKQAVIEAQGLDPIDVLLATPEWTPALGGE